MDLGQAVHPSSRIRLDELSGEQIMDRFLMYDHCSGLIRLSDDEIYVSQDAWFFFGAMNRFVLVV